MRNMKILIELDGMLAERFMDLAQRGAFGASAASPSVTLNAIVNKLIYQAMEAGEKKLLREQKKVDQAREMSKALETIRGIQGLRFTRDRRLRSPVQSTL